MQDTFVRAFLAFNGFRAEGSLRTWLFTESLTPGEYALVITERSTTERRASSHRLFSISREAIENDVT